MPFKYYSLTKVRTWRWPDGPTSAFEVFFNAPDDPLFENWPELSYMFGEENGIAEPEEIELTKGDLAELKVCAN